ncbi:MAG: suppressor of fused domain protein [Crocinitomicaceae bacterium]|nr:suppressor of fused domain protein [Crocinitomicaceae bacterium]
MLKNELEKRFATLHPLSKDGEDYFFIPKPDDTACNILMTSGLNEYGMPTQVSTKSLVHKELYFLLPEYWVVADIEKEQFQWLFQTLRKLKKHVIEKKTWFAEGHTMRANEEGKQLSDQMKQTYLMLSDPVFLEKELAPMFVDSRDVSFLSVVPIFRNEFQHKQAFGTDKLISLFETYQVTERLDEYRTNLVKSRWRRIFG